VVVYAIGCGVFIALSASRGTQAASGVPFLNAGWATVVILFTYYLVRRGDIVQYSGNPMKDTTQH
jgi:hypothetical protein